MRDMQPNTPAASVAVAATDPHNVRGGRWARIAFGSVLCAGPLGLGAWYVLRGHLWPAAAVTWGTSLWTVGGVVWVFAFAAALGARALAAVAPATLPTRASISAGVVMPVVGLCLFLPLTLQAPFVFLINWGPSSEIWVLFSAVLVGHVHVFVAWRMAQAARRMLRGEPATGWGRIWLESIGVACIPGILLYALPPVLVAVTGVAFPLLYGWMRRLAATQRALVDELALV